MLYYFITLYLSFEDDVEAVCLCSLSNYNIFVLVLHLENTKQNVWNIFFMKISGVFFKKSYYIHQKFYLTGKKIWLK